MNNLNSQPESPENPLAAQLRRGEPQAFDALYRECYRMAESQVRDFNLPNSETPDIFQEALFVFVKRLRDPAFVLTVKPSTFLYAVIRNLLRKKTGRPGPQLLGGTPEDLAKLAALPEIADDNHLTEAETAALLEVMDEKMAQLETECRQVLLLSFYEKMPQRDIAERLGYAEKFVKVKKFRCLEYLRRLVLDTPAFRAAGR